MTDLRKTIEEALFNEEAVLDPADANSLTTVVIQALVEAELVDPEPTPAEIIIENSRKIARLDKKTDDVSQKASGLLKDEVNALLESMNESERNAVFDGIEEAAKEHDRLAEELRENKNLAKRQMMLAIRGEVTCKCGKSTAPAWKLYKCYFCGIFFCEGCAPEHFGMTREEHNEKNYKEFMVPR